MPWNFHVTKRGPYGGRGGEIDLMAWIELVERDPEMVPARSAFGGASVGPLTAALWFGASGTQEPVMFEYLAGNVTAVRPDAATLRKLHVVAQALGGHVEDDDGGWYDARGGFLGHLAVG